MSTQQKCKIICLFFGCVTLFVSSTAKAAFTFADIEYWVGTGSNESAMVVDWNDGINPVSLAWGYRWDGTATGEDMLMAIAGSGIIREPWGGDIIGGLTGDDTRLYARLSDWGGGLGNSLFGFGYDVDNDGGGFVSGYEDSLEPYANEDGYAIDSDDHYGEGWFTGYWSYCIGIDNPYDGGSWNYSGTGMPNRDLSNGDWDGWSFLPGFSGEMPSEPVAAAVPEPATLAMLGLGLLGLALRQKRLLIKKRQVR